MILACNDDGIQSEGLTDLVKAVETVDRVVVVAPDRERSAVSLGELIQAGLERWPQPESYRLGFLFPRHVSPC